MRRILFTILTLLVSLGMMAMPAIQDTLRLCQSDGTVVEVLLHGDEHFHYMTTLDGQWVDNQGGMLVPIKGLTDSQIEEIVGQSPMRKMRAQREVSQRRFPTKGKQKSLVILAAFSDKAFSTADAQHAFSTMLNQKGYAANGATGSTRDYYLASSNGQFDPQFVTVGPYTLPHEMAYYGGNNARGVDRASRLMQFCRDAVAAAAQDVDYREYDTDNDGYIDNVFIYYAGYSEAEGGLADCIWPHQYGVVPDSVIGSCSFNGKTISSYACTAELRGFQGSEMCGIGTFCHEFGHVLGLPDYYHTTKKSIATLGRWDVMDSGGYLNNGNTPPTHSAYNRFCMGWLSPSQMTEPSTVNLYALSQDTVLNANRQAYMIADGMHNMSASDPNISEFFILEYRKRTGWDRYMPDSGLIIWHIDYDKHAWDKNTVNNISDSVQTASSHMRVFIENPSGDHQVSAPAAFHSGNWFTPVLWSGTLINKTIDKITEQKDYCTFNFMGGGIDRSAPIALEPEVVSYNSMRASWLPLDLGDEYEVSYLFTAFTLAGGDTAYIVRRELTADTTYLLSKLKEETIYTYYVSAYIVSADTAVETFRSNIVKATTTTEKSLKKMPVSVVATGSGAEIYVSKPSASDVLYVFNERSQLLMTIKTDDNLVRLTSSQLPSGHIYILQAGSKYAKIAL